MQWFPCSSHLERGQQQKEKKRKEKKISRRGAGLTRKIKKKMDGLG
jgi:hypothetical protein